MTAYAAVVLNALLFASIRALAIGLVVRGLLSALRVSSAGVRQTVWAAVLVAMLLMPVLPNALSFVEMPIDVPASIAIVADDQRMPFASHLSSPAPSVGTSVPETATPPIGQPAAVDSRVVPIVVTGAYLAGLAVFLLRLLAGWWMARRIYRSSASIPSLSVYESPAIAVPVTIGVVAPRIVLPSEWKRWPADMLEAVLAHERAHVTRHDTAIALLARINTCVFWFHPMAWWLRRELSKTAELACDAAAVRIAGPRRYAEMLLAIAGAARRSGARVVPQGVAVGGTDALEKRIDKILDGRLESRTSIARKIALAAGCTIAIIVVVACRQRIVPAPLQADAEFAAQRAAQKQARDVEAASKALTPQQVSELEAAVAANPDDLDTRQKLLTFYGPDFSGRVRPDENERIAARRRHILWLIEHHPAHELAGMYIARIYPTKRDWQADPIGYEQAKTLWLAYVTRPTIEPKGVANAASFFESSDKPTAERILLNGQAIAAKRPNTTQDQHDFWSQRLGDLYYQILVGSNAATLGGATRSFSLADAHSAYADEIRQKLSASTDATLLATTAAALLRSPHDPGGAYPPAMHLDFSTFDLGKALLFQASRIAPSSLPVQRAQRQLRSIEFYKRFNTAVGFNLGSSDQIDRIARLPEPERLAFLPELAERAYLAAENLAYTKKDEAGAREKYALSRRWAEDALRLAQTMNDHPARAGAVFRARIALATLTLREGDREGAVKEMQGAVNPVNEEGGGSSSFEPGYLWSRLAATLLESGERESVARLLDRLARIDELAAESHRQSASAIRAGRMPVFYQARVTTP